MRSLAIVPALALALVLIGLAACGGGKSSDSSNGSNAASATVKIPNCGAVKAVWVNLNSKVYHEPGDMYYGKTSHGEYLCPSQAKAQGFRPSGGSMMMNQSNQSNEMSSGHHKRRGHSSNDSGDTTP